ncbi:primosomal protein N' [Parathermosynechococcus lividus]
MPQHYILLFCILTAAIVIGGDLDHEREERLTSSVAPTLGQWVSVLVDCPGVEEAYTYGVPAGWTVAAGDIVEVPFGQQLLRGIVLQVLSDLPKAVAAEQVRPLTAVVGTSFLPVGYWRLLEQVAAYYCTPLIHVVRTALPPGVLGRSQRRLRLRTTAIPPLSVGAQQVLTFLQKSATGDYSLRYVAQHVPRSQRGIAELVRLGVVEVYWAAPPQAQAQWQQAVVLLRCDGADLSDRQRQILDYLRQQPQDCWLQDLLRATGSSPKTIQRLVERGYVAIVARQRCRLDQGMAVPADQPQGLTLAQQSALAAILASLGRAQEFLLHGVTGSGKTEVYLQAIGACLAQGRSALLLVPEIGLTPQLTDRVRARFGDRVVVYHSGLSDGERYDTWRLTLLAEPRVVIGTRSAILLPLAGLGLIVLDEEHDSGYKQDQPQPCYHARTVARWRSQQDQCPLILGSATPALSTWQGAEVGHITYLSLPERIHAVPLPPITVVDMREELRRGNRTMFSRLLQNALKHLRAQQAQAILFIQRRGHSTFVSCRSCGSAIDCPHCSVSLTVHLHDQHSQVLRCHYCNYSQGVPQRCPVCGSPYLKPFGSGTQRVVAELNRLFPDLRVLRFDSDTTQRKGAHRQLLAAFAAGEADVMVGTQMLTKGIDLPQVALVGILAADGLLHLPDYQAAERTFQILTQVAGRSGRGHLPGQVILQTYVPEHPVIGAVKAYAWQEFAQRELASREPLGYPPHCQLILLRLSSKQSDRVAATAAMVADQLAALLPMQTGDWQVLGPAPAAIAKIAERYRWQILLKGRFGTLATLSPHLITLKEQCPREVRLSIDVDPLNFL